MEQQIVERRKGNVVRLFVEIDISQFKEFEKTRSRLSLSKTKAIAAAINIWLNLTASSLEVR